jgi:hypothetical protein
MSFAARRTPYTVSTHRTSRGSKRTCAPDEALHLDRAHVVLNLLHVRLVIPRLHIERHHGLGNDGRLALLLLCILGSALLAQALSLLVVLRD